MQRLVICLFLLLLPGAALAQAITPGKEGELAKIVAPKDGEVACFSRSYDKKHLTAHPNQQVTDVQFRLTYYQHEPDGNFPKGQRNYYFQMLAKTRNHPKRLTAMGECGPKGSGIFCGVECDGGGVMLKRRDGGKLLVDLEAMGRIRMSESCDDEEGVEIESGKDDKTFLLDPLKASQCPVYEDW